ncbi:GntR family transcriptional regulator [Algicella marina]|uniref:FCD domain-containing protein n=1 Tax=Algicella marina TaxID=2683284 RepID=A0A6P1T6U1_9RHOB|nr:GntR family transcriptional regulator [Algicella marina]QHQ36282.1 FCD domain-containing protein [Algicella marina]
MSGKGGNLHDTERSADPTVPAHELVYRVLRARIMQGVMAPGASLTLRGIAAEFGVSMTPAREAARRLVAEGALKLSASGRISTTVLTRERIEELSAIRALLETELATRSLPRAHGALIDRMAEVHRQIETARYNDDALTYVRLNLDFHRLLYLRAQAPAMLALVETVWLQLGPTMRQLYDVHSRRQLAPTHDKILDALRDNDEPGLRVAIREDVTNGLRLLVQ